MVVSDRLLKMWNGRNSTARLLSKLAKLAPTY